jgi:hypothetical protein
LPGVAARRAAPGRLAASAPLDRRLAYAQVPSGTRPITPPTPDEVIKAKALVDRVVEAKGGLEVLRGVKTIVVTQTLTNPAVENDKGFQTTTYIQYPDRFRTETAAPQGGLNVQVYDGTSLWARDPRGVHDQPEALARDARSTLRRDPIALLVAASDGSVTPRVLPDVKDVEGRIHHALELSAPDLNPIVLLIDPETSLINKLTFVADASGRPIVEDEFTDYRPVSGVQIAFQAWRRSGPQAIARRITEIKINSPIDAALFKRPS